MELFNANCLDMLPGLDGVDMVCVDLPYGQTAHAWDCPIDLKKMWKQLRCICSQNCVYAFFCTVRFGHTLINSNPKWFRYDLVWSKSNVVGFQNANIMPMRSHEMVYIFRNPVTHDLNNSRNLVAREYARQVKRYIGRPLKELTNHLGYHGLMKFYGCDVEQFRLPHKRTYDTLVSDFKLSQMDGFRTLADLKAAWEFKPRPVYTSQKKDGYYPRSVLHFSRDSGCVHPTQKPVALLEWLIKSYSQPGETVLDFTMGSGTCGVACINTGRKFIGIEQDTAIFRTARNRLILAEMKLDPKKS
jgi:site-specific DNA-methyltransferase (adenine-specific)